MQGTVAAPASHRACGPRGWQQSHAKPMPPQGRRHGAHDSVPRRLSFSPLDGSRFARSGGSLGQTDCEGVRDRSSHLSPVWLRDATHRGHHRSLGWGSTPPAQDRQIPAGTRCERAEPLFNPGSCTSISLRALLVRFPVFRAGSQVCVLRERRRCPSGQVRELGNRWRHAHLRGTWPSTGNA